MMQLLSCRYNMDTNRVEARFEDEITLAIDCIAIENEYGNAPAQRAELDWLLYNKPLEYAQLVLPTVSLLCTPCFNLIDGIKQFKIKAKKEIEKLTAMNVEEFEVVVKNVYVPQKGE